MDSYLRAFLQDYLRVVLGTLMVVAFVAFASVPYSLGYHPGEAPPVASASVERHFT